MPSPLGKKEAALVVWGTVERQRKDCAFAHLRIYALNASANIRVFEIRVFEIRVFPLPRNHVTTPHPFLKKPHVVPHTPLTFYASPYAFP